MPYRPLTARRAADLHWARPALLATGGSATDSQSPTPGGRCRQWNHPTLPAGRSERFFVFLAMSPADGRPGTSMAGRQPNPKPVGDPAVLFSLPDVLLLCGFVDGEVRDQFTLGRLPLQLLAVLPTHGHSALHCFQLPSSMVSQPCRRVCSVQNTRCQNRTAGDGWLQQSPRDPKETCRRDWHDHRLSFKRPCQPDDRRRNDLTRIAAEAQHQCRLHWRLDIKAAHGANDDAVFACGPLDPDVREPSPRVGDQMHALVGRIDGHMVAEATPDCRDQRVALAAINLPHSADVSGKVSLFHEGGNDRLTKGRWLGIAFGKKLFESRDHRGPGNT